MRFMMFIIPNIAAEQWTPPPEAVVAMERYNRELERAGVLLHREGMHPLEKGARVSFPGGKASMTDGPDCEPKEVIGGFWMIDVASKAEAVEWASRCPIGAEGPQIEIRQIFERADFPPELQEALARAQAEG